MTRTAISRATILSQCFRIASLRVTLLLARIVTLRQVSDVRGQRSGGITGGNGGTAQE